MALIQAAPSGLLWRHAHVARCETWMSVSERVPPDTVLWVERTVLPHARNVLYGDFFRDQAAPDEKKPVPSDQLLTWRLVHRIVEQTLMAVDYLNDRGL